jgi:hypothetical protein
LQAPIVLIWDNLSTHISHRMHALIAAWPWLTVVRLPSYAPDLNPTEGVWRWMKRGLTNIAAHGVDHLADLVRYRLRVCQQQTDLLAGFFANIGMSSPNGITVVVKSVRSFAGSMTMCNLTAARVHLPGTYWICKRGIE